MFGIGPPEMLILLVIGVLLFGKNLPTVGRQIGKGLMEFKKGLNDIKNEVNVAAYADPAPAKPAAAPRIRPTTTTNPPRRSSSPQPAPHRNERYERKRAGLERARHADSLMLRRARL